MTYERLIDKADLCIQAAIRCWNYQLTGNASGTYMGDIWYAKSAELRAKAMMLPCSEVCK